LQTVLFRSFLLACPRCGADVTFRDNLEPPCFHGAPAIRCRSCRARIDRQRIFVARIRHEALEGVSWDCEVCGQENFTVGQPDACRRCGQTVT
jgi:hypothetical protein